jgi:uncharacterized membrane protein SpoIIM required for sporulation
LFTSLDVLFADRLSDWSELETLVTRARGQPNRLGSAGIMRVAELYRSASADLVSLRRRLPHDPRVDELDRIVAAAHHLVYAEANPGERRGVVHFFTRRFWVLIREQPLPLLLASVLFIVPAILATLWALVDPGQASRFVPGVIAAVTAHRAHGANLGIPVPQQSVFASTIFTHNIFVALLAFAGGLTGGVVTAYVLITNALTIGVFAGLAGGAGATSIFVQLVVPHGLLELSCVTIAGTAGFRVAIAFVSPGAKRRSASVATEARVALELVAGASAWLVIAGLVEGFVTPSGIGLVPDLVIGIGLFCIFWGLVVFRGGSATSTANRPGRRRH